MPNSTLNFTMQHQETSQWCWAAVGTSNALFFNPASGWTQCSLANSQLARADCCSAPIPPACVVPSQLDTSLSIVGHLRSTLPRSCVFSECDREISNGKPLNFRIEWSDGSGHFATIIGIGDPSDELLEVTDPLYDSSTIPVGVLTAAYRGNGRWTHSYLTKQ